MSSKILFISHGADRTGAPILLLDFLQWFTKNTDIPFEVLLRRGGDLEKEFSALAPTTFYYPVRSATDLLRRVAHRFGYRTDNVYKVDRSIRTVRSLQHIYRSSDVDLIYCNTIVNGEILAALSVLDRPVITHVHELNWPIFMTGPERFEAVRRHTTHYIAASEAVKCNLIKEHKISEQKIDVVHEFLPTFHSTSGAAAAPLSIRRTLNIPEEALVVGGSGYATWHKGKDLFVQLAGNVLQRYDRQPIHFLWFGKHEHQEALYQLQHDVKKLNLSDRVHFTGEVSNPLDYHCAVDLFAMVSREDSYPIVCLEAASMAKPILCFADAGGIPEFVETDAGFVVPYLDIQRMADKVIELAENPALRQRLGERASEKVRERHDLQKAAPQIFKIIKKYLP